MSDEQAAKASGLRERLEPLRSFLSGAEADGRDRLTSDEAGELEAVIDTAWPGMLARQSRLFAATWFCLGLFVAKYALGY